MWRPPVPPVRTSGSNILCSLWSTVILVLKMDEFVTAFVDKPSEQILDECTKDQLVKIADYYKLDVGDKRTKETVKANLKVHLFKMNVFSVKKAAASAVDEGPCPLVWDPGASLSFEQQKELLQLCMKLETEKLLSLEKIRQGTELARLEVHRHKLQLVAEGKIADASVFGGPSVET